MKINIILILMLSMQFLSTIDFESALIDTDWLQQNLNSPDLLVFHVGQEYKNAHIHSARHLPVYDFIRSEKEGLDDECPDPMMLEKKLNELGVSNDSKIVLYYETSADITITTRMYVTLDFAGMGDNTAILNGGMEKWEAENREITTKYPPNVSGDFQINVNTSMLVSGDTVLEMLNDEYIFVVDARPESQYDGSEADARFERSGHIMYAVNIPFYEIVKDDPDYEIKDLSDLEMLFSSNGIEQGYSMITYCGTGLWASNIYFAAKTAGYEIFFYDGSFQDWSSDEKFPVTEPVEFE
jgi:thiosulfate/3-mercaptopyruvate sulfurtransferase